MTLQRRISISFVPVMLLVAGLIIFLAYLFTRQILSENAYKEARAIASRYAAEVSRQLEVPLDAARTLAQSFETSDSIPVEQRRGHYSAVLKHVLEQNKGFLAVWAVYEPDALDGLDSRFVGVENGNETGRFVSCWNQGAAGPEYSTIKEEDLSKEDYYQLPLATRGEVALQPYLDSYGNDNDKILMTSCIVPVKDGQGKFLGVAGIDVDLATTTALISSIHPYDTGYAFLLGSTGDVIAHPDTSLVTKNYLDGLDPAAAAPLRTAVADGKAYEETRPPRAGKPGAFIVYTPVRIGGVATPWSFGVYLPLDKVMSQVTKLVLVLDAALVIVLLITWIAMVLIVRWVTRPLVKAVGVTN
jgi:methyl-accepting chemotaxis protein